MEVSQHISVTGMLAAQRQLEAVSNNLANVNTTGFRRAHAHVTDIGYEAGLTAPVGPNGAPVRIVGVGEGAQVADIAHDFLPGAVQATGNPLDMAIQGDGFFAVQTPEGTRYTRVGRFQLDKDGTLVTTQGYPVLSGGSPLTINPDDGPVNVAEDGSISTDRARNGTQLQVVGKLDFVDFAHRDALKPTQDNLFDAGTQPTTEATGKVAQRVLEDSNVNPIIEMTNMIQVTRNYQAVQRFLDGEHDRQRRAINSITSSS
jgi:flagellar basal-body rod protein FlgF